jgi:hypothetical protein
MDGKRKFFIHALAFLAGYGLLATTTGYSDRLTTGNLIMAMLLWVIAVPFAFNSAAYLITKRITSRLQKGDKLILTFGVILSWFNALMLMIAGQMIPFFPMFNLWTALFVTLLIPIGTVVVQSYVIFTERRRILKDIANITIEFKHDKENEERNDS